MLDPTQERGQHGPRGFVEVELSCGDHRVIFQPQTIGSLNAVIETIEEQLAIEGISDLARQEQALLLNTLRQHFEHVIDPGSRTP